MGFIREPKNVDLLVAPSILTEDIKNNIRQAIAQYKKTGETPAGVEFVMQGSVKISTRNGPSKHAKKNNSKTNL